MNFLKTAIVFIMMLTVSTAMSQSDNFFFIDESEMFRSNDNDYNYSGIWEEEFIITDYQTGDELPVGDGVIILMVLAAAYLVVRTASKNRLRNKYGAFTLIMLTALTFTQCKKPVLELPEEQTHESEAISISIRAGGIDKTDINMDNGRITWNAGDKVYVVNNGTLLSGHLTASSGSSVISEISGTVTGDIDDTKPFYFYYVGDGVSMGGGVGSISFNISSQTNGSYDVGEYQIGKTAGIILTDEGGQYVPSDVNPNPIPFKSMTAVLRLNTEVGFGSGSITMSGHNVKNIMTVNLSSQNVSYTKGDVTFTSGTDMRVSAFPTGTSDGKEEKIKFSNNLKSGKIRILNGIKEAKIYAKIIEDKPYPIPVMTYPKGALPGKFSVGDGRRVYFSQGNLQYIGSAATPYWHFHDHQWEFYGSATGQGSNKQYINRDLFGYGTSGYNGKTPYMTSTTDSNYPHVSFTDANADYDWGVHNAISNGGNVAGLWRTLNNTMPSDIGTGGDWHCHGGEWDYLVYDRDNNSAYHSEGKYLSGTGNLTLSDMTTVFGAFILPDNYYDMPGAKQQTAGKFGWSYTQDEISDFDIVFLPGAGSRNGSTINTGDGNYWTSSVNPNDNRRACNVWFNATTFLQTASTPSFYMHNGYSVRLVIDAD